MRVLLILVIVVSCTAAGTLHATTSADSHGNPLPPGAVARIGTTRLRMGSIVGSLAFSPDASRITATDYYGVGVFETKTGRSISYRSFPGHNNHHPDYAVAVSLEGSWVAFSQWKRFVVEEAECRLRSCSFVRWARSFNPASVTLV